MQVLITSFLAGSWRHKIIVAHAVQSVSPIMTNYSKWDKFDPDLVCKEIDVQQSIDSSKKAKKKAFVEAATINEQAVAAAKAAAEALQSQVRYLY